MRDGQIHGYFHGGYALRGEAVEYWLKLGKTSETLIDFQNLSPNSRRHPLAIKMLLRALRTAREMNEFTLQS
jgi:hypothetical protein